MASAQASFTQDAGRWAGPAIEARGLAKTYRAGSGRGGGAKTALHGVDLTVPQGVVYGLLGPNGAGKSTFINILAGIVVKSAGSVRIWGRDIDREARAARSAIGVVPQELTIDPFLSPLEALDIQAGLYGVPKAQRRSAEILAALGLSDKANAHARSLSGGMKRRLLVAKALVHNPPVVVLDEPTAGVDIELRRGLWDYMRELKEQGATIILTTHYLEEAEEMCDRIAIIDRGLLIAEAPTRELLSSLDRKTLLIRSASDSAEELTKLRAALPGGAEADLRSDGALAVTYSRRVVTAGAVLAACGRAGVEIGDLSSEEPDLEQVFLSMTGMAGADRPNGAVSEGGAR